ncbi:MAG TPA: hypothetical protein VMB05_02530 [Solirubrobacteraceae bacterium]|nr:hypothetical protein [Solirubrobacteraceae bacterium]
MGKTVWLDLFCADPGDNFEAIKIDFEGVRTCEEFLVRTATALSKHQTLPAQAMRKLKAMFDNVEISGGPVTVKVGVSTRASTDLLAETVRSVDDHLDDEISLVIAMDEVPIAIGNIASNEGPNAANQLLQTLRGLRRSGSKLRWIVCGSVGFHHILRQCDATEGVINDLVNLPLGPMEHDEAQELCERLLIGIKREGDEGAVEALVTHSGSIPFLIHALAHRLHESGTGQISASDVSTAFADFMDDRDDSRAVTHLVTRLEPLYGERARAAETLLDTVAVKDSIQVSEAGCKDDILTDLCDDHYLVERGGAVRWRYNVLQRIWMHRRRLK